MMQLPPHVTIKPDSWIARLAAWKMNAAQLAIVFGNTIHLHQISRTEFLANHRLIRHELAHVEQYRRMGFVTFLVKYVWYSAKYGYYRNPLEVEAREAEL